MNIKELCIKYNQLFSQLEDTTIYHECKTIKFNRFEYPNLNNSNYNEQLELNYQAKGIDTDNDDNLSFVTWDTFFEMDFKDEMVGGRLNYEIIETYDETHNYEFDKIMYKESTNISDKCCIYEHKAYHFQNHKLSLFRIKESKENLEILMNKINYLKICLDVEKNNRLLFEQIKKLPKK